MDIYRRSGLLILSAILLSTIACRIPFIPAKQWILGVVGPETGAYEEMGVSIVDGIMMRAAEINRSDKRLNGGIVAVVHYDDGGDPETGVKSVDRLIKTDEAFAIIYYNPDVSSTAKCAELCANANVPFISLSGKYDAAANPVPAGGYELSPGDERISRVGLDYIFVSQQIIYPGLVVIGDVPIPAESKRIISEKLSDETGFALDRQIGRADIELVDISSDIKFSEADAVLVYSNAEDTFRLVRELEVDSVDVPVINIKPFTEPGVFDDEVTLNRFVYFFTPLPDEFANVKSERFQRHFIELKGYEPNYYHCLGYEAADFVTYAVLKGKSTKSADMKSEWDKIPVWEGILGDTNLKTGETDINVYLYRASVVEGIPVIEVEAEL